MLSVSDFYRVKMTPPPPPAVETKKDPLQCPHCVFHGKTERGLGTHMTTKHQEHAVNWFACPKCYRKYNTKDGLRAHTNKKHKE